MIGRLVLIHLKYYNTGWIKLYWGPDPAPRAFSLWHTAAMTWILSCCVFHDLTGITSHMASAAAQLLLPLCFFFTEPPSPVSQQPVQHHISQTLILTVTAAQTGKHNYSQSYMCCIHQCFSGLQHFLAQKVFNFFSCMWCLLFVMAPIVLSWPPQPCLLTDHSDGLLLSSQRSYL